MTEKQQLLSQLKSNTSDDAVEFAQRLAAMGDPSVIPAILEAVERPENDDVHGPLLQSLIALDCGAHLAALARIMRHEGYEVKFMTVNVMESIMAPVDPAEKTRADETLREIAAQPGLPQDEINMIDYARRLIANLDEAGAAR